MAAEAILGISVKIIQCGRREQLRAACDEEKACCVFLLDGEFEDEEEEEPQKCAANGCIINKNNDRFTPAIPLPNQSFSPPKGGVIE